VTWSRSLLLRCRQTVLFSEGILMEPFETRVSSRGAGPFRWGACGPVCLKAWKTWGYPGVPHGHRNMSPSFTCLFTIKNTIIIHSLPVLPRSGPFPHSTSLFRPCWPGLVSGYGQCTVTVCRRVTECRPASEGLGPAYKTTHGLQGGYNPCGRGSRRRQCVWGAYIPDKLYCVCEHASLKMWQLLHCD